MTKPLNQLVRELQARLKYCPTIKRRGKGKNKVEREQDRWQRDQRQRPEPMF